MDSNKSGENTSPSRLSRNKGDPSGAAKDGGHGDESTMKRKLSKFDY